MPNNKLVINKILIQICLIWAPSPLQISAAPRAVGNAAATKYINLYYKWGGGSNPVFAHGKMGLDPPYKYNMIYLN